MTETGGLTRAQSRLELLSNTASVMESSNNLLEYHHHPPPATELTVRPTSSSCVSPAVPSEPPALVGVARPSRPPVTFPSRTTVPSLLSSVSLDKETTNHRAHSFDESVAFGTEARFGSNSVHGPQHTTHTHGNHHLIQYSPYKTADSTGTFLEASAHVPIPSLATSRLSLPPHPHTAFRPPHSVGRTRHPLSEGNVRNSGDASIESTLAETLTHRTTSTSSPPLPPHTVSIGDTQNMLRHHRDESPVTREPFGLPRWTQRTTYPSLPNGDRDAASPVGLPSHEDLLRENQDLKQLLHGRDGIVLALQQRVMELERKLQSQVLPTRKISQIPVEDMMNLMREYGSEISDVVMPPRKLSIQKASVVRQFRRWNPNFFEYFSYANGRWEPKLGRQGELARRLQSRNEHALEKKQAEHNTPSSSTTPLASSTPTASPRIRPSNGTHPPPAPSTVTDGSDTFPMPSGDAQAEK